MAGGRPRSGSRDVSRAVRDRLFCLLLADLTAHYRHFRQSTGTFPPIDMRYGLKMTRRH